jgi:hypothetical protein
MSTARAARPVGKAVGRGRREGGRERRQERPQEVRGQDGCRGPPLAAALAEGGVQPDVYVCGPPALVDAALPATADGGLPAEHVVTERLLPS